MFRRDLTIRVSAYQTNYCSRTRNGCHITPFLVKYCSPLAPNGFRSTTLNIYNKMAATTAENFLAFIKTAALFVTSCGLSVVANAALVTFNYSGAILSGPPLGFPADLSAPNVGTLGEIVDGSITLNTNATFDPSSNSFRLRSGGIAPIRQFSANFRGAQTASTQNFHTNPMNTVNQVNLVADFDAILGLRFERPREFVLVEATLDRLEIFSININEEQLAFETSPSSSNLELSLRGFRLHIQGLSSLFDGQDIPSDINFDSVQDLHSLYTSNFQVPGEFDGYAYLELFVEDSRNESFSIGYHLNQFSLASVSEVPVPAAAWLFGSALIGLAGIKRKK